MFTVQSSTVLCPRTYSTPGKWQPCTNHLFLSPSLSSTPNLPVHLKFNPILTFEAILNGQNSVSVQTLKFYGSAGTVSNQVSVSVWWYGK
jgi:hypothetical protein